MTRPTAFSRLRLAERARPGLIGRLKRAEADLALVRAALVASLERDEAAGLDLPHLYFARRRGLVAAISERVAEARTLSLALDAAREAEALVGLVGQARRFLRADPVGRAVAASARPFEAARLGPPRRRAPAAPGEAGSAA